ncbi:butyrophilin-like protein 2 [Ctenodactylus gundi]
MVDFPGYSLSGMIASFIFILMTMKQSADFRVVGPAYPVLARIGEDALLSCRLLPKRTAEHMEVRWYRLEPGAPALARQDGPEVTEVWLEEHGGRVEKIEDGIAEGRVALKIRDIQPSDDGQYWCRFQEGDYFGETNLLLQVAGLGSAPDVHMAGPTEGDIQLVCSARGWFPEPEVFWEDTRGEKLMSSFEHHIQDEDGLFYVEDTLVVRDASVETVSCFIHNPVLAEGKGTVFALEAVLRVVGSSQPVLVRVGENVQLTCHLSPEASAQGMEVRWVRSYRYPAVHVYVDGDHLAAEQMAEYRGRTALVSDAIQEGRLTLQLRDVRASDDGQYRCLFEKHGVYQEASVDLEVVAVGSSPLVTLEGRKDGEIRLMCTSDGWFPQPQVQWRDAEGRTAPSFSEALHQDSHGLFRVETILLLTNSTVVDVTCSVRNLRLGEERTATFGLSAWSFRTFLSDSAFCLVVAVSQSPLQETEAEVDGV